MYKISARLSSSPWTSSSVTHRDTHYWQFKAKLPTHDLNSNITIFLSHDSRLSQSIGICHTKLFQSNHHLRIFHLKSTDHLSCSFPSFHTPIILRYHHPSRRKLLQLSNGLETLIVVILAVVIFVLALVVGFLLCYFGFFNELLSCLGRCFRSCCCARKRHEQTSQLTRYSFDTHHRHTDDGFGEPRPDIVVIRHKSPARDESQSYGPTKYGPPPERQITIKVEAIEEPEPNWEQGGAVVSVTEYDEDEDSLDVIDAGYTTTTDRERKNTVSSEDRQRGLSEALFGKGGEPDDIGPATPEGDIRGAATLIGTSGADDFGDYLPDEEVEADGVKRVEKVTPLPPPNPRKAREEEMREEQMREEQLDEEDNRPRLSSGGSDLFGLGDEQTQH